jgi:hypothetical protein
LQPACLELLGGNLAGPADATDRHHRMVGRQGRTSSIVSGRPSSSHVRKVSTSIGST